MKRSPLHSEPINDCMQAECSLQDQAQNSNLLLNGSCQRLSCYNTSKCLIGLFKLNLLERAMEEEKQKLVQNGQFSISKNENFSSKNIQNSDSNILTCVLNTFSKKN